MLLFCYFVWRTWRRGQGLIHNSLFIILALGLFDHYFLTLQQGQLMLAVVLGWGLGKKK